MKPALRNQLVRLAAGMCFSMVATSAAAVSLVCQFIPVSGAWNVAANWGGDCATSVVPGINDRAEVSGGKTAMLDLTRRSLFLRFPCSHSRGIPT